MLEGSLGLRLSRPLRSRLTATSSKRQCHIPLARKSCSAAFKAGELNRDVIAVVRFQGPKASGMPELHRMTPPLAVLQDKGFRVGLVTDGRMSGASGKVPAAIHVTPEAADGGPIAEICAMAMSSALMRTGTLEVLVDAREFAARDPATADLSTTMTGTGRELFAAFRKLASRADQGASILEVA